MSCGNAAGNALPCASRLDFFPVFSAICAFFLDFSAAILYNTFVAFRFSPYRERKDYARRKSAVLPPETIRRLPMHRHPPLSRQFPVLVG